MVTAPAAQAARESADSIAPVVSPRRPASSAKPTATAATVAPSVHAAPLALHFNLGYTRARGDEFTRRDLFHASTAAVVTVGAGWQLLLYDIAVDTNPERARSTAPGIVRIGAIYTVRPGCDVDFGYQTRLNDSAPRRVLLAGLTVRW